MKTKAIASIVKKTLLFATATVVITAESQAKDKNLQSANSGFSNSEITARLTTYTVKPEYEKQFRKALAAYAAHALTEESNIMAEAYYEKDKTAVLWLMERWENKKAMQHFSKSVQAKALLSLQKEALVQAPQQYYLNDLEPLTKEQWRRTANKEDSPLLVMLFVDAKMGTQKDFKTIYHKAMPEFRSEPGVVTYQLSEIEGDETQFVTYEKFRSDDAFQYHLKFPPIKPVIEYLETSIKKPPFQNGLHNLIEFAPLTRE